MKTDYTPGVSRATLLPLFTTMAMGLISAPVSQASDAKTVAPVANGASLLGGALPGGAVISTRYVTATPASGGQAASAAIASDGSFSIAGLAPGPYRLSITSSLTVPKQTQGATFGEKVNAGLHAAGSAVAQGAPATATKHDTAKNSVGNIRAREGTPAADSATDASTSTAATQKGINGINGGMPNRISMNVTVARQTHGVEVDGAPVPVDVGADGMLAGRVAAVQQ